MIILNQDFFSNFAGSMKSKDTGLTKDLLLNELSDVIAYDEQNVISLLNKAGISTKENTPDDKLVEALINGLPSNEKLQRGIAYMIADNHDLLKIKIVNKKTGAKSTPSKDVYIAIINKIYEGMQPILEDIKRNGEEKKRVTEQIKIAVKDKCKTSGIVKATNKVFPKWAKWTLIGVGTAGALTGIGILIYKYAIKPKMAVKMGAGGAMPPTPPVPIPVPAAAAPSPAPAPTPIPVPSVAPVAAGA